MKLLFATGETLTIPSDFVSHSGLINGLVEVLDTQQIDEPIPLCNSNITVEIVQQLFDFLKQEVKLISIEKYPHILSLYMAADYLDVESLRTLFGRSILFLHGNKLTQKQVNTLSQHQWFDIFNKISLQKTGTHFTSLCSVLLGRFDVWDICLLKLIDNQHLNFVSALNLQKRLGHIYNLSIHAYLHQLTVLNKDDFLAIAPSVKKLYWTMSWMMQASPFVIEDTPMDNLETIELCFATESRFIMKITPFPSVQRLIVHRRWKNTPLKRALCEACSNATIVITE